MRILVATALIAAVVACKGSVEDHRSLEVPREIDLGPVTGGMTAQRDVPIFNPTGSPITFVGVWTTPGWRIETPSAPVAPGARSVLSVRLDTTDRHGPLIGHARLATSSGDLYPIMIRLKASVLSASASKAR
jgi:hypothetical protein